jgi:bromodomain adjacent to zinc finger domain protein 1A
MPTLNKQLYVPALPPTGIKPSDEVFLVRTTGEIVKDYEEYLKKTHMYRLRQWGCYFTGKTGMTYQEALQCEIKSRSLLDKVTCQINNRALAVRALL